MMSLLAQRVVTGVALLVVFLAVLFLLPPLGWALAMLLVVLLAADELGRLLGSDGFTRYGIPPSPHYRWLLPMGLLGAVASFFFFLSRENEVGQMGLLAACYTVSLVFSVTLLPWWLVRFERGHSNQAGSAPGALPRALRAGFAIVGGWLLFSAWLAMVQLRAVSPWILLALLVLIWLADSAAYFTGRVFGKHKLAARTSPGKTWEGALGALLAVTVYALMVAPWIVPQMSALQSLSTVMQWVLWLCLAWALTVLSVLGDLFESLIKRHADRKDSGVLLPGHGGVLDRIDSLLTTMPVAALIASLLM